MLKKHRIASGNLEKTFKNKKTIKFRKKFRPEFWKKCYNKVKYIKQFDIVTCQIKAQSRR
jgi:hypothetical protein